MLSFHDFIYSMPLSMFSNVHFGLQAANNKAACIFYSLILHMTECSSYPYHLLY